jgi:hypothetical protein
VLQTAEFSAQADSEDNLGGSSETYALYRTRCTQEDDQLLREGRGWPCTPRGQDCISLQTWGTVTKMPIRGMQRFLKTPCDQREPYRRWMLPSECSAPKVAMKRPFSNSRRVGSSVRVGIPPTTALAGIDRGPILALVLELRNETGRQRRLGVRGTRIGVGHRGNYIHFGREGVDYR